MLLSIWVLKALFSYTWTLISSTLYIANAMALFNSGTCRNSSLILICIPKILIALKEVSDFHTFQENLSKNFILEWTSLISTENIELHLSCENRKLTSMNSNIFNKKLKKQCEIKIHIKHAWKALISLPHPYLPTHSESVSFMEESNRWKTYASNTPTPIFLLIAFKTDSTQS